MTIEVSSLFFIIVFLSVTDRGGWDKLAGGVMWPPPTCAESDKRGW